jgi:asparagine synthase (glutamine-hydrolysing)
LERLCFQLRAENAGAHPGFDKTINRKSLVSCINYLWVSGNETMFNGCFKLPAAHYATYTKAEGVENYQVLGAG